MAVSCELLAQLQERLLTPTQRACMVAGTLVLPGWFLLTENEEECVVALRTDPLDRLLLAGDTAGVISIYDITTFCTLPHREDIAPQMIASWQAHSAEIVSIDYIGHETEPLVLSASADCTVRLWTISGHYVGMFGQKKPWSLRSPSSYQHPSTPWGEIQQPTSHLSVYEALPPPQKPSRATTPQPGTVVKEEESMTNWIPSSATSSTSSLGTKGGLARPLTDKSLGSNYDDSIHKRMSGRHERRTQYAGINTKATQRFGGLCSPYQALQLLSLDEVKVPQEMVSVLQQTES